jgi:glycosyltransferase involved in cell wall biosynthesis
MSLTVTVCIPAYNSYFKFERCAKSVLQQDECQYEILVSDDSTDEKEAVQIKNFCKIHNIIYWRNSPSLGPAENWNKLINESKKDLIKFLHHDDELIGYDSLAKFVRAAENQTSNSIIFSDSRLVDQCKKISYTRVSENLCNRINNSPSLLYSYNVLGAPSACIFRNTGSLYFRSDFKWLVDLEFYYRAIKYGGVGAIAEPLVQVDISQEGRLTSAVKDDVAINIYEHVEFLKEIQLSHWHVRLISRFCKMLLRTWKNSLCKKN